MSSKADVQEVPTRAKHGHVRGPTLITEQEVMFSTAVAAGFVHPTVGRRLVTWISRFSLPHLPPPRVRHDGVLDYLESARMSREMERL